jgi:hypothetical protein
MDQGSIGRRILFINPLCAPHPLVHSFLLTHIFRWYNSSDLSPKGKGQGPITGAKSPVVNGLSEPDSRPLDFETFIPTHDPSLNLPQLSQPPPFPGPDYSSLYLPNPPGPIVSQSEAFMRATGAFYWAGYWTAIYHVCVAVALSSGKIGLPSSGSLKTLKLAITLLLKKARNKSSPKQKVGVTPRT